MKVSVILACAGRGVRSGLNTNKVLHSLDGENCLQKCLKAFTSVGVDQIVVTANSVDFEQIQECCEGKAKVILGGETRTASVKNALALVDSDVVLIHDGARPFVTEKIIKDCIDGAIKHGGVIPVIPSVDTIVSADECVNDYLGKQGLYKVQTPQAFKTELIKKAYDMAGDRSFNDDGEVFKTFISNLYFVEGDARNVKLTFAEDFVSPTNVRFGTGFDCHKLVEGRKLILGGVEIPHVKGLLGHSDADVLTHAVMDAILSACALGDIGKHFPDSDIQYKYADSIQLLKKVLTLIDSKGFKVQSVSATVMAEQPKLKPYIYKATQSLAAAINISPDKIGIGATTLEGLGFVGREEGICVNATAVVVCK